MFEQTDLTCVNHPERAAVERCEVCGDPLCAYCLYYTSNGQRLCKTHAEEAQAAGAFISAPGVYADGLIGAQVNADRSAKTKYSDRAEGRPLYEANNADVLSFVGLLLGVVGVAICIPGLGCLLSPIGIIVCVLALVGAKGAMNPRRTRQMAGIGIALAVLWTAVLTICVSSVFSQMQSATSNISILQITLRANINGTINAQNANPTFAPTDTPAPRIPTVAAPDESPTTAGLGR